MIESFEHTGRPERHFFAAWSAHRIGVEPVAATPMSDVLSGMLDHVDYPMLLVDGDLQLLHANRAGWRSLDESQACDPQDGELQLRCPSDMAALRRAIDTACTLGLRSFVLLKHAWDGRDTVSVLPQRQGTDPAALLMLGKVALCEALTLQAFARNSGLTDSEARVLNELCAGHRIHDIALSHGVALSTIRTQVGSLRAKTGARSISHLLRQVASLPPLVSALSAGNHRLT